MTIFEKGMGGDEAVALLNENMSKLPNSSSYKLTENDILKNDRGLADISGLKGVIHRFDSVVTISAQFILPEPDKKPSSLINAIKLPEGYTSRESQGRLIPITTSQSGTLDNRRAVIFGTYKIAVRGIKGNCYISGTWYTDDDFPNE